MENNLLQPVATILEDFLSSQDFDDPEINQTFRATAKEVFPEALIALFVASHLECSSQTLGEATFDKGLRRFLHGLLFATFGLHNLEILVEFEKQVANPTKLRKSLSFCTGGLCLANACLILKNENQRVLDEIYGLFSASALVELKRRRAIGRFDFSKEEYLGLCRELSAPLKLFVVGPMFRCTENPPQLDTFVKFVECVDVPNRLTKELNVCFGLEGNLAAELNSEQPPLLLQLGAKHSGIRDKVTQLIDENLPDNIIVEMRGALLRAGLVGQVRETIELYLSEAAALLQSIRNQYSRSILQGLFDHVRETYEFNSPQYRT